MFLGYNTNGLVHHRLMDALSVIQQIGYKGVALTIDHHALSPHEANWREQLAEVSRFLKRYELRSAVETGARYLLDPWHKHEPTLLHPDPGERSRRLSFYQFAIRCAAELGSDCVSVWSGRLHSGQSPEEAWELLCAGFAEMLEFAGRAGVRVAFEPEPGMFIDTLASYEALLSRLGRGDLWLTLDIGHLQCQGEVPIAEQIRRWAPRIVNIHIEDMRRGVHEHLMFGEGEIDFPAVLQALTQVDYQGGIYVELSRHSERGPEICRRAFEFLQLLVERAKGD